MAMLVSDEVDFREKKIMKDTGTLYHDKMVTQPRSTK